MEETCNIEREVFPDLEERFLEPEGWKWGYFTNKDGAKLRYGHISPTHPKNTIVLVHGFTEFSEKYFETIKEFIVDGYAVWSMDWHGQGGSDRYLKDSLKPYSLGFEHDVSDLHRFVKEIVKVSRPILVAHSFGGHIGLRALHDYKDLFCCAILTAPMIDVYTCPYPRWLASTLVRVASVLGLSKVIADHGSDWRLKVPCIDFDPRSHDPVRRTVHFKYCEQKPELRLGNTTFGWTNKMFESIRLITELGFLSSITTPVLIGCPMADKIVKADMQEWAVNEMPNAHISKIDNARHELWMESDIYRKQWKDAVKAFLSDYQD